MKRKTDTFLENRMARYDQWLKKGKIDFSSKIIPIRESINTRQWVLPTDQVLTILRKADPIGLTDCVCRSHYQRCDHPREVCLLLNSVAAKEIEKKRARPVTVADASKVLNNANERGLVHLAFYMPGPEIYALCSCCDCCCHDLQILKKYQRPDLVVRSDFIAVDDPEKCIHCGECVQRCVFNARRMLLEKMNFDPNKCYGCGLCPTTCPVQAIDMRPVDHS
ncbi:MAG: hypothetical protein DSY89_06270 [Deltaproteobacteria bacterium]|nr:MAG: hypothetical protein DSY89_06270 [Deltaproteobacteria bacterium]